MGVRAGAGRGGGRVAGTASHSAAGTEQVRGGRSMLPCPPLQGLSRTWLQLRAGPPLGWPCHSSLPSGPLPPSVFGSRTPTVSSSLREQVLCLTHFCTQVGIGELTLKQLVLKLLFFRYKMLLQTRMTLKTSLLWPETAQFPWQLKQHWHTYEETFLAVGKRVRLWEQ